MKKLKFILTLSFLVLTIILSPLFAIKDPSNALFCTLAVLSSLFIFARMLTLNRILWLEGKLWIAQLEAYFVFQGRERQDAKAYVQACLNTDKKETKLYYKHIMEENKLFLESKEYREVEF